MKWNKKYKYPKSIRELINNKRHYDVGEEKLPSVTTILSGTESDQKREAIAKWKKRVGAVEAESVKNKAATRGTALHSYLEKYILGEGLLDLTDEGVQAERMAKVIIEKGLPDLSEIWGSECVLHYPGLYAGATDLCGIYQGRESIIDFKQSNKPKRKEWISDYFIQLAAYAMAHNYVYNTKITQGVILMCTKDNFFQKFVVDGQEFINFQHQFLRKIDQYYSDKKSIVA